MKISQKKIRKKRERENGKKKEDKAVHIHRTCEANRFVGSFRKLLMRKKENKLVKRNKKNN